jgi:2-amino-4-hydroxy-6-hydroxymethyldihydropteridine diphosphokinase
VTDVAPLPPVVLPPWAVVTERRAAHIARVVTLIDAWARAMALPAAEGAAWHDAARWHDALRDAPEEILRSLAGMDGGPPELLHGPAAAARLRADGESRSDVLDAIRWHTVGHIGWARTGQALYMADFLEPGRPFAREQRAYLARQVPHDFDGTFREAVRARVASAMNEGKALAPETAELWNSVR